MEYVCYVDIKAVNGALGKVRLSQVMSSLDAIMFLYSNIVIFREKCFSIGVFSKNAADFLEDNIFGRVIERQSSVDNIKTV